MSTDLLFEHFATLATAPDGIARLRELCLQLAVQGKLGTQDAGDEPASILLEQIREENLKLINEGTRKKNKKQNFSDSVDFSLHIPKNWTNCILEDITLQITDGEHIIPPRISRGVPLLTAKNVRDGYLDLKIIDYVDPEIAKKCWKRCKPIKNDVLMVCIGSIGRLCHVENPPDVVLARSVALLRPNEKVLYPKFLETVLKSPYCQNELQLKIRQVAQPGLYLGRLCKLVIPLPPLAEQHRIVEKVARLITLCDELEARQQQERAGCLKLGTASLAGLQNATHPEEFEAQWAQVCDAFDLILDCPENVAVLRQTILQLAVQGRLVRQEPGDEPAGVLIKRIQTDRKNALKDGRIKKLKILKPINAVEILYSLPNGWTWARFPEVGELSRGKSKNRPRNDPILYINGKYPLVQTGDVSRANSIVKTYSALYNEAGLKQSRLWPKGTMCITIAANIAETAILGFDACFPDSVVGFIPHNEIGNTKYFEYFMRTAKEHLEKFAPQTAQKNINVEILENLLIPLPPLAEQHRIVAKVDALMKLCDALESRLKERAAIQTKFTDAVVKNVETG